MGGCWSSSDDNEKLKHEGWKSLKEKSRWCTDIPCALMLIAAWVAMTFVGLVVLGAIQSPTLRAGNPHRLTNAMDYEGNICGYSSGYKHLKKGYYLPDFTAVCIEKCPSTTDYTSFYCHYDLQSAANSNVATGYAYVVGRVCMYQVETKDYVNRCFPNVDVEEVAHIASTYAGNQTVAAYQAASESGSSWFSDFLGDVNELRGYIFGFGLGLSTGVAFFFLLLLRIPGLLFIIIWSSVLSVFFCLLIGSILLLQLASSWSNDDVHTSFEVLTMKVIAYIGLVVTGLYFCLIVVLRKRVQLAIGVVKQAARALSSLPMLLLLPVFQAIGLAVFLVPWFIYVLFLASSGEMVTHSSGSTVNYTYRSFTYTQNTRYAFLYMIFIWFWTSEFIVAFGQLVISLSFASWYFSRDKALLGIDTVRWAFKTASIYHTGTAAFGSLIIAIIKTIRTIIAYIQRKVGKKKKNIILVYIMCVLQCFMWCLEKIMKFINKHAYIITAIYGYGFCRATRKAFFLLLRNIMRVAAVNLVSSFVLFIGKILIPMSTTFLCYLALAYATNSTNVTGIISPLVFVFLMSYWIGSMFLEIFGMGIETILFCFIADEEMFKPEDRFAEAELMTTIQKTAQAAAAAKIAAEEETEKSAEMVKAAETADNFDKPVVAKPVGGAVEVF